MQAEQNHQSSIKPQRNRKLCVRQSESRAEGDPISL
jgi:hypothetical protein